MKTSDFYIFARKTFQSAGFDSPGVEAEYLLEDCCPIRRNTAPISSHILTDEELKKAQDYLARRLKHEPYQYICGHAAFRELDLNTAPGCLIPRPETEILVDHALSILPRNGIVCELGTGSGAIALSLAYERKDISIRASEISPDALSIAQSNLDKYKLHDRVSFYPGDLFSPFDGMKFDAVVANLPYIAESDRDILPANVRLYEPEQALFAGNEGFALLRKTIQSAPEYLKPDGWLFLEIGETQGMRCLEASKGLYRSAVIRNDQYQIPRYFIAQV